VSLLNSTKDDFAPLYTFNNDSVKGLIATLSDPKTWYLYRALQSEYETRAQIALAPGATEKDDAAVDYSAFLNKLNEFAPQVFKKVDKTTFGDKYKKDPRSILTEDMINYTTDIDLVAIVIKEFLESLVSSAGTGGATVADPIVTGKEGGVDLTGKEDGEKTGAMRRKRMLEEETAMTTMPPTQIQEMLAKEKTEKTKERLYALNEQAQEALKGEFWTHDEVQAKVMAYVDTDTSANPSDKLILTKGFDTLKKIFPQLGLPRVTESEFQSISDSLQSPTVIDETEHIWLPYNPHLLEPKMLDKLANGPDNLGPMDYLFARNLLFREVALTLKRLRDPRNKFETVKADACYNKNDMVFPWWAFPSPSPEPEPEGRKRSRQTSVMADMMVYKSESCLVLEKIEEKYPTWVANSNLYNGKTAFFLTDEMFEVLKTELAAPAGYWEKGPVAEGVKMGRNPENKWLQDVQNVLIAKYPEEDFGRPLYEFNMKWANWIAASDKYNGEMPPGIFYFFSYSLN